MNIFAERLYPTPVSNSTLLPLLLLSLANQRYTPDGTSSILQEYDYVIVGAGSAGSVVAGRLSEMPCVSVLLLEAGKPPPLLTEVPGLGRNFWFTDIDWQYKTAPQKYTGDGLVNRQVVWPSGKAVGGSSILNGMVYVRGNRKNYDDWAAQGAEGWSYKDVLKYFKKLEDNEESEYLAKGYHAVGGPVTMRRPLYAAEFKDSVLKSGEISGYKLVDSNGPHQTGLFDFQATIRDGQRCSTAKSYLVPAENRTNLHILPNAFVTKIIIENKRAVAVQYDVHGLTYQVRARRDVIISAGAINTAQLLMLSGIGPKEELAKFGLAVVADLPVGRNLQDHSGPIDNYVLSGNISTISDKLSDPENIARFIINRTGPLGTAGGDSVILFPVAKGCPSDFDFPDRQLYFTEGVAATARDQFGMKSEVYRQVYGPYENKALMMCFVHTLQPKSLGTVTLRSANPYDPPVIDPNYLAHPDDLDAMVEGLKTCRQIATSQPLWDLGIRPFETLYPRCEAFANDLDAYFRCQAQSVIVSHSHQSGTAKMGDPCDPNTVVDPQLRVKYIDGLRIVDASIMPIVPSGNTNVPVIMVAEKASDIIKSSIKCGGIYTEVRELWQPSKDLTHDIEKTLLDKVSWPQPKVEDWSSEAQRKIGLPEATHINSQSSAPLVKEVEELVSRLFKNVTQTYG